MPSFLSLLLYISIAELLRRCYKILVTAFTGPLSKVPGPLLMKLSVIPWAVQSMRGTIISAAPRLFDKYGDTVRVGPNLVIFAGKAAIQKIVVEDDLLKSPDYEWIRTDPQITNLITERDRVAYRQKRRLLSTGFSISYLNGLESLMRECIKAFVDVLASECESAGGSAVVDMYGTLSSLTSDVMSATSFGGSFDTVRTKDTKMKNLFIKHLQEAALHSMFTFLKWIPFMQAKSVIELDEITDSIVSKRLQAKDQNRKDLLQIFLDTHQENPISFSGKHIKEEMRLFMIAGSDTTGTSATFAVLLLLENPQKLQTLKNEIDSAFPSKGDDITFANTQDLSYLNATINEALRVMPIVAGEDTMLDGYVIPQDTIVGAWLSRMFMDSRIWPDAYSFIPERWLGKYKGVEADRKAFMAFSAGSRSCIGQQFALKEMRLILANLIHKYDLKLVPGQSKELRVHVVPYFLSGKYFVEVKRRF